MRRFNPDKELNKIQRGNRNKIILFVISLLVVGIIGYSFALYQVRYSRRIIYTKVAPFSNRDINLAVYWDDTKYDKFPERSSEYAYDYTECDGDSEVDFNYSKWQLDVHANGPDKCDVYFKKIYKDDSGANPPELYKGLIPIRYENNEMYIADVTSTEKPWYNYDNHEWANAVLIDHTNNDIVNKFYTDGKLNIGDKIEESDILQMYVWIPRYKYQLFNAVNGQSTSEQEIKIEFENGVLRTGEVNCSTSDIGVETCENAENGNWYTHPAFTFGKTELTGIWVGKFEPSGSLEDVTIKPNSASIAGDTISNYFGASRNIEIGSKFNVLSDQIDTHMMKNMEWGAVAYLSNSKYGIYNSDGEGCTIEECKIYINNIANGNSKNSKGTITGCAASTADGVAIYTSSCPNYTWNTQNGVKASTTGNMYGIYDMVGGSWDYAMGNVLDSSGNFNVGATGFIKAPEEKYYDKYEYGTSNANHERGHLGDATRETLKVFGSLQGGWNGDHSYFPNANGPYFARSGSANANTQSGVFAFGYDSKARDDISFRVVLTAQDGNS